MWPFKKIERITYTNIFKETTKRKPITELTNEEGEIIFKELMKHDQYAYFTDFSFEPVIMEDGSQQITFSGRSIIGICGKAGCNGDSIVIPFYNIKVIKHLYLIGYEISDLLEEAYAEYLSTEEQFKFFDEYYFHNELEEDLIKQLENQNKKNVAI